MDECKSVYEKELFKLVQDGDLNEMKRLIVEKKLLVNCYDDQGMTPLQHAAYKGNFDLCKLLLDCGADVNADRHIYKYSALCFAALSNHGDVVTLLLDHGASKSALNSVNRTAAQMAAFVAHYKIVDIINNYISKEYIDYFTRTHGLKEFKLPLFLSGPFHRLVIMPNIHPVKLVLYLQSNNMLLENMKKCINVLNLLAEKQLKDEGNEMFSLKFHHMAYVFSFALDFIQQKKSNDNTVSEKNLLENLIKVWLSGKDNYGISENLEKFLRKDISSYPYQQSLLFQQILRTISKTDIGNEPNSFTVLINSINGQHGNSLESCATCNEQQAPKKCSKCKTVQYCNKECQKLHWSIHKLACKNVQSTMN